MRVRKRENGQGVKEKRHGDKEDFVREKHMSSSLGSRGAESE